MADTTPKSYSADPALYLYTSLTSGSSHIVTATSRLETILKANKIPFKALDIATDEKARMLWGRRAGKDETGRARKIPGLVQMGLVIGDLVEIEEWNEYGELKEHITIYHEGGTPARSAAATPSGTPSKAPVPQENRKPETATSESSKATDGLKPPAGAPPTAFTLAMRQAGQEAAQKAKEGKKKPAEMFDGVGEAEPTKETTEKMEQSAVKPPPVLLADPPPTKPADVTTILQSPTSTAWRRQAVLQDTIVPHHNTTKLESLQSPSTTAWKPTDVDLPVMTHRGSSVSLASAEEIRQIEQEEAIPEEDEEDDDDEVAAED